MHRDLQTGMLLYPREESPSLSNFPPGLILRQEGKTKSRLLGFPTHLVQTIRVILFFDQANLESDTKPTDVN
jgi:hypothetical protein